MSSILRSVITKSRPALTTLSTKPTAHLAKTRTISTTPITRLENLVPPETAYPESMRGVAFEPTGWRTPSDRTAAANFASSAKDDVLGDPDMERPDRAGSVAFVSGIGREYI